MDIAKEMLLGMLLVRAGIALHVIGTSRSKTAGSAGFRSLMDLCVGVLAFWLVGQHIAFWTPGAKGAQIERGAELIWAAAGLIGSAVVQGALGERTRFWGMMAISFVVNGIVAPLMVRLGTWDWIVQGGLHDPPAIGRCVLAACAMGAMMAKILGGRSGKYHRDGSTSMIPGHQLPLVMAGAFFMIAGWSIMPFRESSILGGAAGALAGAILSQLRVGKPDPVATVIGLAAGLMTGFQAVDPLIVVSGGVLAGVAAVWGAELIDIKLRVDDPSGLVAGLGAGAMGTLLILPFRQGAKLSSISMQLAAAGVSIGLGMLVGGLIAIAVKKLLTVSEDEQYEGLDLVEHEMNAYPDFQQTTIKSYHTREA